VAATPSSSASTTAPASHPSPQAAFKPHLGGGLAFVLSDVTGRTDKETPTIGGPQAITCLATKGREEAFAAARDLNHRPLYTRGVMGPSAFSDDRQSKAVIGDQPEPSGARRLRRNIW
jgi:hypothetical protein